MDVIQGMTGDVWLWCNLMVITMLALIYAIIVLIIDTVKENRND